MPCKTIDQRNFFWLFQAFFRTLSDWLTNFRSIFLLNSYSFKSGIFHFILNKFSSSTLRQLFTKFSAFWLKILLNFIEKINKKFVKIEFGLNKFLSIINLIKFPPPPSSSHFLFNFRFVSYLKFSFGKFEFSSVYLSGIFLSMVFAIFLKFGLNFTFFFFSFTFFAHFLSSHLIKLFFWRRFSEIFRPPVRLVF